MAMVPDFNPNKFKIMAKQTAPKADETVVPTGIANGFVTRFQCASVLNLPGAVEQQRVSFSPVVGALAGGEPNENDWFATGQPSGTFELLIDKEDAIGTFKSGAEYFITIQPVGLPETAAIS